ncbi:nucleotide sugar dehydrogenase [Corynebacterium sp. Marseille-P3884]|uniref:nucleotide sugar dehydrogenase n=1 Tax=Corynebacterium sp. Marseille-P3884 TaxID=2495409 RepID=UPI001B33BEB5|nr:nucleotide sugar dehydrogenase [Corynebacterium sp. Marseille-P3884]MBP3947845.1 nucleotide sugar dehydrogenase [Corynebacterium sp. Marseille-P3884]
MNDSSRVVTIVGQGYVGLPLAQAASAAGWKVFGLDVSDAVVARLNAGESHVDDLSNEDIATMVENGYEATVDASVVAESNVVVICVPTPLGDAGAPDLKYVESACQNVGEHLTEDTLVILESTTYPGTTEDFCVPILEGKSGLRAGSDFQVAFSPERVDPGSKHFGIKNTPKLVGGINPVSAERTAAFYSDFVDEVVPLSGTREAESAKLLENTFRHVNIALVNELTRVFHEMDIDVWEVIRGASTKPFGFMKFTPGAGVGGHCIPIDPGYLSYEVRRNLGYPLRFVELAQEINNSAPNYVVQRIAELLNADRKPISGSTVLLLGVTYKPDISDQRESPAVPIAEELLKRGANLKYHDPFVEGWRLNSGDTIMRSSELKEAVADADVVVLLQGHSQYDLEVIEAASKLFLDTTGKSKIPSNRL